MIVDYDKEDPEQRFLRNQQARTAARHKHTKSQDVHAFWRDLRGKLIVWNEQLKEITITAESSAHHCTDATERRSVALQHLEGLQHELKRLQKEALSELDLPASDLNILHTEFSKYFQKVEDVHNVVCPPTRFVFARYRAAWKERELRQDKKHDNDIDKTKQPPKLRMKRSTLVSQGRVLQDISQATITEGTDGVVEITSHDGAAISPPELDLTVSTSLVVQNLMRCNVTISAHYKLLHLIDLEDCIIKCSNRIDGAIHITSCTNTKIIAKCHQLRIHESRCLDCHVEVGSGPILEDSSEIHFYSSSRAVIRETRDFNWFRSGDPSPNFDVTLVEETPIAEDDPREVEDAAMMMETSTVKIDEKQQGDDDVDEEDEL